MADDINLSDLEEALKKSEYQLQTQILKREAWELRLQEQISDIATGINQKCDQIFDALAAIQRQTSIIFGVKSQSSLSIEQKPKATTILMLDSKDEDRFKEILHSSKLNLAPCFKDFVEDPNSNLKVACMIEMLKKPVVETYFSRGWDIVFDEGKVFDEMSLKEKKSPIKPLKKIYLDEEDSSRKEVDFMTRPVPKPPPWKMVFFVVQLELYSTCKSTGKMNHHKNFLPIFKKSDLRVHLLSILVAPNVAFFKFDSIFRDFLEEKRTSFPSFIGCGMNKSSISDMAMKAWFSEANNLLRVITLLYYVNKMFTLLSIMHLDISDESTIGFASQQHIWVKALEISLEAKFIRDFVLGSETLKSSAIVPPPTVLDYVLKDLFHEVMESEMGSSSVEHKSSRSIKGAPLESLFTEFYLHALWFRNFRIHAIVVLWIEFVWEVLWCWEESQQLPRIPTNGPIDLSNCLINHKLHKLVVCMDKKYREIEGYTVGADESETAKEGLQIPRDIFPSQAVSKKDSGWKNDSNDAGVVAESLMLLKSCKIMHSPITQDPPPISGDMHQEQLKAAETLGGASSFSDQLEKEIMVSYMSTVKVANHDDVFEDVILWQSSRDWENEGNEEIRVSKSSVWPPHGKTLGFDSDFLTELKMVMTMTLDILYKKMVAVWMLDRPQQLQRMSLGDKTLSRGE
ncbi:hypothetical protein C2S52_000906 [Perilla frutescens var. hirtella]|nr:hypothetical protein C2S52_000906 [Perilla frutescens var. hirtella]